MHTTNSSLFYRSFYLISITFIFVSMLTGCRNQVTSDQNLQLHDSGYIAKPGLNIMVFNNWYDGYFSDSKMSGVEIIHHEVRTATNGDVRLLPTPEQWDAIPHFIERSVNKEEGSIEAHLEYPDHHFKYMIKATIEDNDQVTLSVHLPDELPKALEGRAGFNLEFLPSAYFEKSYLMDQTSGTFPLYPSGPMKITPSGETEPQPLARGHKLVLAPADPERHITIHSDDHPIFLYDGRNKAQNGWFVARSLIPANQSGKVIEWQLMANTIPNWTRKPMIAHSQVGYHPGQDKIAVVEFDKNYRPAPTARLLQVQENGDFKEVLKDNIEHWGSYLRYNYYTFNFSSVSDTGLFVIETNQERTKPFRISPSIYKKAWQPTMDIFFPVQMDHVLVNEAYRVWHGASHLDDALQAPVNHEHFDLYAQGPTTDSPYEPGEHIPGLNVGGWYDAGDYDIRTQTQYHTVTDLVHLWEQFGIQRDETLIDREQKYVDIHHPDGEPDILQQIEHGTLALLAQHKAVGHAIPGIIVPDISQYTHLGDGLTMTDNLIYNPELDTFETDGFTSGKFDDRWAFTSKSSALNYGSAAALAAASRALKGYNDPLANECLQTAKQVWETEHSHPPDTFRVGNTTGGPLIVEEFKAAVELLICTQEEKYAKMIDSLWTGHPEYHAYNTIMAFRALPYMNDAFKEKLKDRAIAHKEISREITDNPFGVPISTGGWAGNGWIIRHAIANYEIHKVFPDIIDRESVFKGLHYIYGCHPGSNISFVSGVGTRSKKVAYGMNRADFSFIAGGIVPGVLILPPDFPENKEDWPFLWGENEYVIGMGAPYIYLVHAADELLNHE